MQAITFSRYGPPDVLELREVERPAVAGNRVLVRVRAASVNPIDWHFMTGLPMLMRAQFGLLRPKITRLGVDLAGEVEAVGDDVTQFRPGDRVFGSVDEDPHAGAAPALGSLAEYVSVSEGMLAPMPADLAFEQAAAVPTGGMTALQGLRDMGRLQAGQSVLINGASGGVGTFAVQLAKAFGADVTGVCSTRNVEMVGELGADRVIDYTGEDFTKGSRQYDLILDNVGNRSPSECRRVLKPEGVYVASFGRPERRWLGPVPELTKLALLKPFVSQRMVTWVTSPNQADLLTLRAFLEEGDVVPVIDRTYPLSEVPEAMRYLAEGHARGKVVVSM